MTLAAASDGDPGREALRVPARDLAAHAFLATGLAWGFWATLPALVIAPPLLAISGVVPVAATGIRKAGLVAAVRALATGDADDHLQRRGQRPRRGGERKSREGRPAREWGNRAGRGVAAPEGRQATGWFPLPRDAGS